MNESFARKYLSGEQVLGRTISVDMADENPFGEIIGIAGDVREGSVDREPQATVYYPHSLYMPRSEMNLVVRAAANPMLLVEPVRRAIHDIDPAQPVADFAPMESIGGDLRCRSAGAGGGEYDCRLAARASRVAIGCGGSTARRVGSEATGFTRLLHSFVLLSPSSYVY